MKQLKDFHIIETTDEDVSVVFYFTDGTKQIVVFDKGALQPALEDLRNKLERIKRRVD